jgi:hypothetical protein
MSILEIHTRPADVIDLPEDESAAIKGTGQSSVERRVRRTESNSTSGR